MSETAGGRAQAPLFSWEPTPATFRVEEIGAPAPTGSGEHLQFRLEKRGLDTWQALDRLGRALDLKRVAFGCAGLKDARAHTFQDVTVLGLGAAGAERLAELEMGDIRLGPAVATERKLRPGQAAGNRFEMRLTFSGEREAAVASGLVRQGLDRLARLGLGNAFGPQRFGLDGRAAELGRLLLEPEPAAYLLAYAAGELDLVQQLRERREARGVARPGETEPASSTGASYGSGAEDTPRAAAGEELLAALESNDKGAQRRLARVASALPPTLAPLARQLARRRGDLPAALESIPRRLRRMHLCAHQALVFNRVLELRGDSIRECLPGDHLLSGFKGVGAPGAGTGQLPSGPLYGRRSPWPEGHTRPGSCELAALTEAGLTPEILSRSSLDGARRALCVFPGQAKLGPLEGDCEKTGATAALSFTLPPGAYATIVLRDLHQSGAAPVEMLGRQIHE